MFLNIFLTQNITLYHYGNQSKNIETVKLHHKINILRIPIETKAMVGNIKINGASRDQRVHIVPHIDNVVSIFYILNYFLVHIYRNSKIQ